MRKKISAIVFKTQLLYDISNFLRVFNKNNFVTKLNIIQDIMSFKHLIILKLLPQMVKSKLIVLSIVKYTPDIFYYTNIPSPETINISVNS